VTLAREVVGTRGDHVAAKYSKADVRVIMTVSLDVSECIYLYIICGICFPRLLTVGGRGRCLLCITF